jgi:hypothetical protein
MIGQTGAGTWAECRRGSPAPGVNANQVITCGGHLSRAN